MLPNEAFGSLLDQSYKLNTVTVVTFKVPDITSEPCMLTCEEHDVFSSDRSNSTHTDYTVR